MPLAWVRVVRADGGGLGEDVFVDGNYVDPIGVVSMPFRTATGQNTFETLDLSRKPNWRKIQTIELVDANNKKKDAVLVMLERVLAVTP